MLKLVINMSKLFAYCLLALFIMHLIVSHNDFDNLTTLFSDLYLAQSLKNLKQNYLFYTTNAFDILIGQVSSIIIKDEIY